MMRTKKHRREYSGFTFGLFVLIFSTGLSSQAPERTVVANVLSSEREPKVRIQVPKSAQYLGADRWVLYGIADCELHVFVEANAGKHVRGIYWVQFESYVPTMPALKHEYTSPRHVNLGGLDFYLDTWVRALAPNKKPNPELQDLEAYLRAKGYHVSPAELKSGSDEEHMETLIRTRGYHLPAEMASVRLVHLIDEEKRKELMIIYSEDLAPTGFSAGALRAGGKERAQWPHVEAALIANAQRSISVEKPSDAAH